MPATVTAEEKLEAARALKALIFQHRESVDAERRLSQPILEAMASGTPVLTSTTGAAPEISGGWAVSVDPYDVEAIADGIDRALETPATVIAQARQHARAFTWERCASQTLALYRHILCSTRRHRKKS